jgi:hypothetical protein
MGFQFIREECYARVRSQGAPGHASKGGRLPGKRSAREVIAEAVRSDGAAPHVARPLPPRSLFGLDADELPLWMGQIESLAGEIKVKTKGGERRQRSDTPILLGVVASYPARADEGNAMYVSWREKTIEFLKARYGTSLICVLEHSDEAFGHLHAVVTNKGMSVKGLHAGHSALQESLRKGEPKKAQSEAYKNGARRLQDDYFGAVGMECGLARIGPRKRRKTRAEWHAEKQANASIAASFMAANRRKIESMTLECNAVILLEQAEREVQRTVAEANAIKTHQINERSKCIRQQEELKLLEQSNIKKESELNLALRAANVENLLHENNQLRQYVSQLSGLLTEASHVGFPENQLIDLRRMIVQKP